MSIKEDLEILSTTFETFFYDSICEWSLGLYSLSGKTSYRKISWSLEAARFEFKLFQSLWNLAGTSAALLPRCLSNFRAILPLQHPISRLRDFTRFGGKTSYRLVNRGPGAEATILTHVYWWNIVSGVPKFVNDTLSTRILALKQLVTRMVYIQVTNDGSIRNNNTPHTHVARQQKSISSFVFGLVQLVFITLTS